MKRVAFSLAFVLAIAGAFAGRSASTLLVADLYEQTTNCPARCATSGTITCTTPISTPLYTKGFNGQCNVPYVGNRYQP